MRWQRDPFESGDFGEIDVNGEYGEQSPNYCQQNIKYISGHKWTYDPLVTSPDALPLKLQQTRGSKSVILS